jgi:hypothetical protein
MKDMRGMGRICYPSVILPQPKRSGALSNPEGVVEGSVQAATT